ncbi:hypothetical protein [Methanolapillus millepedarum]|uniref:Uncharacterized protein n=1 Tax=Methanolapillus millepedarum TaxID=3028296 RepID=A0AA96V267_9EURY|nr:hypothetical protein MsAc7_00270 [Methanosarcinaceae archaeon Ac7]
MIGILIVLILVYAFLSGNLQLSLSFGTGTGSEVISMLILILTLAVLLAVGYSFFEDSKKRNYIYQIWLFDYVFCLFFVALVFISFLLSSIVIHVTLFTFSFDIANGYFVLLVALFLGVFYLIYSFTRLNSTRIRRTNKFVQNLLRQLSRNDFETFVMDLDVYFDSISGAYDKLELRESILSKRNIPLWKADRDLMSQIAILFNDIFENRDLLTYIVQKNRLLTMKLLRVRLPRDYPKKQLFKNIAEISLENNGRLFALPPKSAHIQSNMQNFIFEDQQEFSEIVQQFREQNPKDDFTAAMAAQKRNGVPKDVFVAYTAGVLAQSVEEMSPSNQKNECQILCGQILCDYHVMLTTKFIHEKKDLDLSDDYFNADNDFSKSYRDIWMSWPDRLLNDLISEQESKNAYGLLDKFVETHLTILSVYVRAGDFSRKSFPRNILEYSMIQMNRMMKMIMSAEPKPIENNNATGTEFEKWVISTLENYFRFYFELLSILQNGELKDEFANRNFETLKKAMNFSKKYDRNNTAKEMVSLRNIADGYLKKKGKTA